MVKKKFDHIKPHLKVVAIEPMDQDKTTAVAFKSLVLSIKSDGNRILFKGIGKIPEE